MYRYEENSSGLEYLLTALDLVSIREISSSKSRQGINWISHHSGSSFIVTSDKEVLPLFNHMGKVVVRSITSVPKENDFGVFRDISRINHGTKSRILIPLSGRLD